MIFSAFHVTELPNFASSSSYYTLAPIANPEGVFRISPFRSLNITDNGLGFEGL